MLTALALCSSDNSLAASPIDDNSTNPPSISMVGGSGDYTLLLDKYGQWMNIDLRSENVTEAIEGLKLNSHPNQNNIFVAQGTTNIYLKSKPIDNQTAGNPYGLRIFQGAKDNNTINATFNVLDILVSSEDPNGVRAKGIELGGTHQQTGVHDETVGLMGHLESPREYVGKGVYQIWLCHWDSSWG